MAITFVNKKWTDSILTRLGRSITYTPVTKTTDNTSGDETFTTGTPVSYSGVFTKLNTKWTFEKQGLFDGGDAWVIFKAEIVTPNKNSTVTVDGETFRIDNVITRYSDNTNSTAVYHFCNLFKTA